MPFLEFPQELHHIVYRINAIELLNVRLRSVRHRGHFPTDQVALKVVCLTAIAQRPNPFAPGDFGWAGSPLLRFSPDGRVLHFGERRIVADQGPGGLAQ